MLGRLFKYEMKAISRILIPIYLAMLAISTISAVTFNLRISDDSSFAFVPIMNSFLFSISISAAFIVTVVMIVWRFYRSISGGEGYLLFTLPVKTTSIIFSQFLCALVWCILMSVVLVGCLFIQFINADADLINTVNILIFSDNPWQNLIMLLNVILSYISEILTIYFSISLASLFGKHRLMLSVVFYVVAAAISNLIDYAVINILCGGESLTEVVEITAEASINSAISIEMFIYSLIIMLAISLTEYLVIRYILNKRLNIE